MINRYNRIDSVRVQNALISVYTLRKNCWHQYRDTNKNPCSCSRAWRSNRFILIEIQIALNRFHMSQMLHGKISLGGLLTAHGPTFIIVILLLFGLLPFLVRLRQTIPDVFTITLSWESSHVMRTKTPAVVGGYVEAVTERIYLQR